MESFEVSVDLACPVAAAFEIASRPEGIKQISPPTMGLFFVSAPEQYALDARIQFKVQAMGLVREIVHSITAFDEPHSFVEEQVEGPFQAWIHEHVFEPTDAGGVRVIDRIRFKPPGGVVGLIMNASKILENLEEGFDYRHDQLERMLGK